ncbi:MAG TPA: hypothetical protein VMB21_07580, partial [Candidatus Limnocylindria bacterium]|nr:hypothetical protein [Candidatus Limnocylindria bacterium]
RAVRHLSALLSFALVLLVARAAEFHLITGDVYKGKLTAADKDGLVVLLDSGDFSPRVDWAKLSDETLKELADDPRAAKFVEPFLEPPAATIAIQEAKEIPVKQPARLDLPDMKKGVVAALTTPNGMILLLILFFGNLYGAFEVARFKWRPVALVCGLSAVLPVVGPLIFLVLPRNQPESEEGATRDAASQTQLGVPPPSASASTSGTPSGGAAAALGISKSAAGGGQAADGVPRTFKRGESTFNRRFFETQFPTFFRVVTTEADKDLVIEVSAGKKSVIAARISRIASNEINFKTANNQEIAVTFAEITEVKLRHKDAA